MHSLLESLMSVTVLSGSSCVCKRVYGISVLV